VKVKGRGSPEGVTGAANGRGSFPIPWTRVFLLIVPPPACPPMGVDDPSNPLEMVCANSI
jgi:hypothetical protein